MTSIHRADDPETDHPLLDRIRDVVRDFLGPPTNAGCGAISAGAVLRPASEKSMTANPAARDTTDAPPHSCAFANARAL